MKPHLRIIGGRPVAVETPVRRAAPQPDEHPAVKRERAVQIARQRFGQPFCHEHGATWKPRSTKLLEEWIARRRIAKSNGT